MSKQRNTKKREAKLKFPAAPAGLDGVLLTPERTGLPMNIFISRRPKGARGTEPFILVDSK